MKHLDRRKAVREIRNLCRERGIEFEEHSAHGAGSHGSWIFSDAAGSRPVRVVIVYDKEISPPVQRSVMKFLRDRVIGMAIREGANDLLHAVYEILEGIFGS